MWLCSLAPLCDDVPAQLRSPNEFWIEIFLPVVFDLNHKADSPGHPPGEATCWGLANPAAIAARRPSSRNAVRDHAC
jgi:hypothetical protein